MAKAPVKKKPPAKKTPRPAKDVKAGDLRSQYTTRNLSPQQSAKDLKAGDLRSSYLNRGNRLPVVVEQTQKVRGNPNMARPSSVIKQGYTPGSASRAVVPYTAPVKKGSVIGSLARGAARAIGRASPVGALIGMTTEAGSGSDKPSGKLFSPSQNRAAGKGNPKTVNRYGKTTVASRPEVPGSYAKAKAKTTVASRPEVPGSYPKAKAKTTVASRQEFPGSYAKASVNTSASEFKKKNLEANQKVGKKAMASKPMAVSPKAETFAQATRRNTTDQYLKNKMKPKSNLLSLIRNKKKG
jgi:hypothetical protein